MTELPVYVVGLFTMLALAMGTACCHPKIRWQIVRCALAILFNWIAGASYAAFTENYTPWQFSIFIDIAAAIAVMYHPAGRVQGYIGLFYFFQIAGHVAFGCRRWLGLPVDPIYYYDSITWVAWVQLITMGGWCGTIWGSHLIHRYWHRRDETAGRAHNPAHRKTP